jgi:hypothetical protein
MLQHIQVIPFLNNWSSRLSIGRCLGGSTSVLLGPQKRIMSKSGQSTVKKLNESNFIQLQV